MRILLHHPALLPPRDYGGVERVVLWLAKGLREIGHEVTVAASPGSRLSEGVALLPVEASHAAPAALLEGELGRAARAFDVVHFMAPQGEDVEARLPVPSLLTVHGNGKPGERFPRETVFLSADHARRHGRAAFVYNGVDPAEYLFEPEASREAFLFLSKTSWKVKNVAGAVSLCAEARSPLWVAGGNRPFRARARLAFGRLRGLRNRWVGPVAGEAKARLLSRARALVFPVLWDEPFGLVVVEALMSGAPVLASPRGSLPELVPADVGALPASRGEWVRFLSMARLPFSPARCRAWALEKFHYRCMAEAYASHYHRLQEGKAK